MKNLISGNKTLLMIVSMIIVFLSTFVVAMIGSNAELIQVTLDTVDTTGNHLSGQVVVNEPISSGMQNTPYTFEMAAGGSFRYRAWWGGLATPEAWFFSIDGDTTYSIDARTLQVIGDENTPGITKVNFVFMPLDVTLDTVDTIGNHLSGQVVVNEPISSGMQNTPYTFEMAAGGSFRYRAWWGGLATPEAWFFSIDGDTTYSIDARTLQVIGDENTPGITRVNFVFIISPTDVTQNLITTTENLNLLQGTENSLTSKLDNVIDLLNADKENAAINVLNALINQIKALSGKQLTNEEADELIRIIEAIIDSIG